MSGTRFANSGHCHGHRTTSRRPPCCCSCCLTGSWTADMPPPAVLDCPAVRRCPALSVTIGNRIDAGRACCRQNRYVGCRRTGLVVFTVITPLRCGTQVPQLAAFLPDRQGEDTNARRDLDLERRIFELPFVRRPRHVVT